MNIIQSPSPNYGSRQGYKPFLICIHCTDGYFPSDMQFLQSPVGGEAGPVSAHFVVAPNGDIHQLVSTDNTAWHAGRVVSPTAKLLIPGKNPNLYSIGIETSTRANVPITYAQKNSLTELIVYLGAQYQIPLDRDHVIGHREIYSLKTCPGILDIDSLLPPKTVDIESQNKIIALLRQLIALLTNKK